MSLFRVTLDGNVLSDEPEGLMEFVSELKRDKSIRGQVLLVDLTLKFKGGTDGYNHLKPLIDCQGFCAFSEITIDESCNNDTNWVQIFDGLIFYTEVKENLFKCILECQLTDNSFYAKIDNNKNIEAYVNVGRSKNDEAISSAQMYIPQFFDVVTGLNLHAVNVFPVWTCFEFIIDYMTDGEMGFVSDYFFGNLVSGDGRFMTITTGNQIRLGPVDATLFPFISFQKLFEEVNKKVRIAFSIETSASGQKVMRIEPESYFYQTGISVTLNNVKGIIKSVDASELYSRLKIGSTETIEYEAGKTDFPTDIQFVGFKDESYTVTGKCNVDNTLDLVSDWIIDSNVIQSVLDGNTGYDEDIFFVMVDYITDPFNQVAIQTDVFNTGAPPVFYNDFLRNANVAQRWLGGIPNNIALYLGPAANNEFQASKTISDIVNNVGGTPAVEPVSFQNDFTPPNFDAGNNYSIITYEYNVPATGYFTFFSLLQGTFSLEDLDNQFGAPVTLTGLIRVYDAAGFAGGNLLSSSQIFNYSIFADHGTIYPYSLSGSAFIHVNAGEKVLVAFSVDPIASSSSNVDITIDPGSLFACTNSATSGGTFQTYNPEDFKAYKYEIKGYPLTFAQYQTIIASPLKLVGFNDGSDISGDGWIDNMKYNHIEGTADFLLSKSLFKTTCE